MHAQVGSFDHWLHYLECAAWAAQLLVGCVVLVAWCGWGREPDRVDIVLLLVLSCLRQTRRQAR